MKTLATFALALASLGTVVVASADPLPPDTTYRSLPTVPLDAVIKSDQAAKPQVMQRQQALLSARYDLANRAIPNVRMSGGRKPVQAGVRVKLPGGITWEQLGSMTPDQIRERNAFPGGFTRLPHVKQSAGGQVFPQQQIDEIQTAEHRDLRRFDVDFDIPDHFTPEFPAPIFLQSRPDLGDVSQGKLLTIRNFYSIMIGVVTPVQMEGLRLLLTPFPQEEFNQTEDRKVLEQSDGVACLDCHQNFHSNAAFHLTPDVRPQAARFRLDSTSLRGLFNQQIHGSKRSLRSVEDFTEFEQRTAYFNGDHVSATRKGVHLPDRPNQVARMAQMQNMIAFPPAPKLRPDGSLDPSKATAAELAGEKVFNGKGTCGTCHVPRQDFLDHQMHDLMTERFFKSGAVVNDQVALPDGPINTFTLRGIKDSPPYLHDGRLLTLADTVEFFNLVLGTKLDASEKEALVTYMLAL